MNSLGESIRRPLDRVPHHCEIIETGNFANCSVLEVIPPASASPARRVERIRDSRRFRKHYPD